MEDKGHRSESWDAGDTWAVEPLDPAQGEPPAWTAQDYARRFQSDGALGRGGMGIVERVVDKVLERRLALKRSLDADGDRLARFLREARLTARLQHPAIVPVHDLGLLPDGTAFFTMQEVSGQTFRHRIDDLHRDGPHRGPSGQQGIAALVEALSRACEAVAYAHQQGVVHRDLKPENLMIGEHGRVFVIDWGVASAGSSTGVQAPEPPRAAARVGTPGYWSPEQARGETATPRSDVHALGVILREILTGSRGTPQPGASDHLDLLAVAEKACAADPADRYADAGELDQELVAWRRGRPVGVYAYPLSVVLGRWARRWRAPLVVAGVALLVLATGAVLSVQRIATARSNAEQVLAESLRQAAVRAVIDGRPTEGAVLAAESLRLREDPLARGALLAGASWPVPRLTGFIDTPPCASLGVSPDGRRVGCSTLGALSIHDLADGHLERLEHDLGNPVLAWTPGMIVLVSDALVATWRPGLNQAPVVRPFAERTGEHTGVAVVDGRVAVVRGSGGLVELTLPDLEAVTRPTDLAPLYDVAAVDGGLALAGGSGLLLPSGPTAWSGELMRVVPADSGSIAVAGGERQGGAVLRAFRVADGAELWSLQRPGVVVTLEQVDEHLVAALTSDGVVTLIDARRGEVRSTWPARRTPGDRPRDLAVGGSTMAVALQDGGVLLYERPRAPAPTLLRPGSALVYDIEWRSRGRMFVVLQSEDRVIQLDDETGEVRAHMDLQVPSMAADLGDRVVLGSEEGLVSWRPPGGDAEVLVADAYHPAVVALPGDRGVVATGQEGGAIVVGDGASVQLNGPELSVLSAAVSPDGRLLAVPDYHGVVRVYDVAGWSLRYELPLPTGLAGATAWSPSGERLAVSLRNGTIAVVDTDRWQVERVLPPYVDWALSMAWTEAGLFASGWGEEVIVFDGETFQPTARVPTDSHRNWTLALSPDGSRLAVGRLDGEVRLWRLDLLQADPTAYLRQVRHAHGLALQDGVVVTLSP